MKKVALNMTEDFRYSIIKKLVETKGNKLHASLRINCSIRHINRMINGYIKQGKSYFSHGNKLKIPANKIPIDKREDILSIYKIKYSGANFNHYRELLEENENIKISYSALKSIFDNNNIFSPQANRHTKRLARRKLKEQLNDKKVKKKKKLEICNQILDIEESHPRQSLSKYFGEQIQMDASQFKYNNEVWHLHAAIDNSNKTVVGLYFDRQETLKGYYEILYQILNKYGIPALIKTDNRTVFEYRSKTMFNKVSSTQFSYACKQLGIELITTSVSQAKGRVERLFGTIKPRLQTLLKHEGVETIEQANKFLISYIEKFNCRFALPINNTSAFSKSPEKEIINLILGVLTDRKIDDGHCIKYNNKYFLPTTKDGKAQYFKKGNKAIIVKALDGKIYANICETFYSLSEVSFKEKISQNFDFLNKENKAKIIKYIPKLTHPWMIKSYNKHFKNYTL